MRKSSQIASKRIYFYAVSAGLAVSLCGGMVHAQVPDLVRHFQFLPRHSVLTQTGGFAGLHLDHRVLGTYDLITSNVPWSADARFGNVDAWASVISPDPTPAYVLSLDQVLNLSGLVGKQLPVAAPFDVFRFEGTTEDGSSVRLFSAVLGNWMALHGETDAPAGSADFFEYELRALARRRPAADFDLDGLIDGSDLEIWATQFGDRAAELADDSSSADATGDGAVDGADLLAWQLQAGEEAPNFAGIEATLNTLLASALTAQAAAASPIPEPGTSVLLILATGALACRRATALARRPS